MINIINKVIKILTASLLLPVSNAHAQNFYYGVGAGFRKSLKIFEFSKNLPLWYEDNTVRTPYNVLVPSLQFGYKLNKRFSLETGLQFANEGYKENQEALVDVHQGNMAAIVRATYDLYHDYYYLRLPLKISYAITPVSRISFSLFAGPDLGFLLRQSFRTKATNEHGERYLSLANIEDALVHKLDIGVLTGFRVQTKINSWFSLFFDGSYYQGFRNILKDPKPYYAYDYKNIRNRHLGLDVGLQLKCL